MATARASEVAKNFGEWHDKAINEPVVITKHGRESVVLLSAHAFGQLTANYREVVDISEIDEVLTDAIEHSDIPERHRWNSTDEDVPDSRRGV